MLITERDAWVEYLPMQQQTLLYTFTRTSTMEISSDLLQEFEEAGMMIIPNALHHGEISGIQSELLVLQSENKFKKAGIGKKDEFVIDLNERGDFISWIDPERVLPHTSRYVELLQEIIQTLNRNFYLGIRDFEIHYAHYPAGTFYKKHVDRHRAGSSRVVSVVLYLNETWQPNDGGELVIYHEDTSETKIQPIGGHLAIFLSSKEHEVLPTLRSRMSITGWLLNENRL
jgi:SM-20-related protein